MIISRFAPNHHHHINTPTHIDINIIHEIFPASKKPLIPMFMTGSVASWVMNMGIRVFLHRD